MTFLLPLVVSWLAGAAWLALDGRRRAVVVAAALVSLAVLGLDLFLLADRIAAGGGVLEATTGGWPAGIGIRLRVDRLGLFFAALVSVVLSAVLFHEAQSRVRSRLFPGLVLLLSAGLHGAFFTGDLFNFYVFFELSVMCSFALAAYGYGRSEIRGAFAYVVVNLLGSVLFLAGAAATYQATGTLDFAAIASRLAERGGDSPMLPATLVFTALAVKLGLFPFHGWVPVLYSHAQPAVASALAGALVNVTVYGLLRIGTVLLPAESSGWSVVLLALGGAGMVYGALLALVRRDPGELVAYAAVHHAGTVVVALGIGGVAGVTSALLTVLAGSLDKSAMFLSLDAAGATRRTASFVAAASAAGAPFTAGFVAKIQLFRASFEGPAVLVILLAVGLASLLTAGAAFRFWRLVRAEDPGSAVSTSPAALALVTVTVAIGILPAPILRFATDVAGELLGGRG